MRAAILCPGPSLASFADEGYDALIAVNRAAEFIAADYWVLLDVRAFARTKPLGAPTIVTSRFIHRQIETELAYLDRADIGLKAGHPWARFSATTAIALAAHLGATRIDCYGMDLKGKADWDGATDPRDRRTMARWEEERKLLDLIAKQLADDGCVVQREFAHA